MAVSICDLPTLHDAKTRWPTLISDRHLVLAGTREVIQGSLSVQGATRLHSFYLLKANDLIWPEPLLDPCGRPITVNRVGPLPADAPTRMFRDRPHASFFLGDEPNALYIGNLPYAMTDTALLRMVTSLGDVRELFIVADRMTGRSKGFGFVQYAEESVVNDAILKLNGQRLTSDGYVYSDFYDDQAITELATFFPPDRSAFPGPPATPPQRLVALLEDSSRRIAELIALAPDVLRLVEWRDLERLLCTVFHELGYQSQTNRPGPDGGVDLTLAGPEGTYAVQVKHWVTSHKRVGADVLKSFVSVIIRDNTQGGIVLATSGFTHGAVESLTEIERSRLRLGDSFHLVKLCRSYLRMSCGLFLPSEKASVIDSHTMPATAKKH